MCCLVIICKWDSWQLTMMTINKKLTKNSFKSLGGFKRIYRMSQSAVWSYVWPRKYNDTVDKKQQRWTKADCREFYKNTRLTIINSRSIYFISLYSMENKLLLWWFGIWNFISTLWLRHILRYDILQLISYASSVLFVVSLSLSPSHSTIFAHSALF